MRAHIHKHTHTQFVNADMFELKLEIFKIYSRTLRLLEVPWLKILFEGSVFLGPFVSGSFFKLQIQTIGKSAKRKTFGDRPVI